MRRLQHILVAFLALAVSGCGYYFQAARGHMDLMSRRVPIADLLADPATPASLRERLRLVSEARRYASARLALPDNGSYTSYVALDREFVVWNVFAAPEFSLEPKQWCFPVAGCVVYRGYFDPARAREYADGLAADGWDVHVAGAAAYSTLGRFDDPVISTMLAWDDLALVSILFHELAHQRLYVRDDSAFNEAFATAVQDAGMRRWLRDRGDAAGLADWTLREQRAEAVELLIGRTRERLVAVYASGRDAAAMRTGKAAAFRQLRQEYEAVARDWGAGPRWDAWFDAPLNNASLVPLATYRRLLPAFRVLLDRADGDLEAFYNECRRLGEMDQDLRHDRLEALMAIAPGPPQPMPATPAPSRIAPGR